MDFSSIKVLSFDCYGTLIDWASGIEAALTPWLLENGQKKSRTEIVDDFMATEAEVEAADRQAAYPDILAKTHAALGERWEITSRKDQAFAFAATVGTWPVFPDTVEALQVLKAKFRLVILSNVDNASFALTNKALQMEFDAILTAEDIGSYKPNPANFRHLVRTVTDWGLRPVEHLHVAQSVFHDIIPAHDLGIRNCWIDRQNHLASLEAKGQQAPPFDARYENMKDFAAAALAVLSRSS